MTLLTQWPFLAKTCDVIRSLSLDQQRYIYEKTKELKQAIQDKNISLLDKFKINDPTFGIMEVFLENSTRTKESFRNAIAFHNVKGAIFDVWSSSINKKESYADTFNMLAWYENKIFIVRSKLEGLCTWLGKTATAYAERHGNQLPAAYINAGDGKHEHPTQEMLDQFSFLEQHNRDRSHIHIALIWDLLHGRTVHGKVEGLRIFDQVTLDLIAPDELQLPKKYIKLCEEYWYTLNIFDSLDTYLKQSKKASSWYFTRVQLERMWEDILKKSVSLRSAITISRQYLSLLSEHEQQSIQFYHPLPRDKTCPVLPSFLDDLSLNGRERQSQNGLYLRIVLLWALAWVPYLNDFKHNQANSTFQENSNITYISPVRSFTSKPKVISEWVNPLKNGIVIDHICTWRDPLEIRSYMQLMVQELQLDWRWWERIGQSSSWAYKWIIFRPGMKSNEKFQKKCAALCPGSTLNIIGDEIVQKKLRLGMPPKIYWFEKISCTNTSCISHPSHQEWVQAEFTRMYENSFICHYCKKPHTFGQIRWFEK